MALEGAAALSAADEAAEALIAAVYLAGTNTRRVKRALFGLFQGAVGKDVVSRAWRKVKVDWDAWVARSLADEDIVRLILDGTVIRTRLDRKATNISVLAAIGVRRDGQKILLSIKNMGGESTAAWRQFLDDLDARGLKRTSWGTERLDVVGIGRAAGAALPCGRRRGIAWGERSRSGKICRPRRCAGQRGGRRAGGLRRGCMRSPTPSTG